MESNAEVHFANIGNKIINHIEAAKVSIKIAVAWFTNPEIFEVLLNKAKSGLDIEVVISDDPHNFKKLNFSNLTSRNKGVWIRERVGKKGFMHQKFCILDAEIVITGSYNWSVTADYSIENIVILKDKGIANTYLLHFERFLLVKSVTKYDEYINQNIQVENIEIIDSELYQIVQRFNRRIFENIEISKTLVTSIDYDALYSKLESQTPIGYAKKLANVEEGNYIQRGLEKLALIQRLELSFEYLIISPEFSLLFDDKTIEYAKKKLKMLGYVSPL
jgi:hypothetical protein